MLKSVTLMLVCCALGVNHSVEAALRYRLTELAVPPGYPSWQVAAISNAGHITGAGGDGFEVFGLFWATHSSVAQHVTGNGDNFCMGHDVNSAGTVVGISHEGLVAYQWQSGSDLTPLPQTLHCCPRAEGINDAGAVVGRMPFNVHVSSDFAALWSNGTAQNLGAAPGHVTSIAYDISNAGHIVGQSNSNAARWTKRGGEVLAGLVGNFSYANGVNSSGEIVGLMSATGPVQWTRPFHWLDGVLTELPLLSGPYGQAEAINEAGLIVGMSATSPPGACAVVWKNGSIIDLNQRVINRFPGVQLLVAQDINDSGEIVVNGHGDDGQTRGYYLMPINPADIVIDDVVNIDDLVALITAWGPCAPKPALCDADVNDDGNVNIDDLVQVILQWSS